MNQSSINYVQASRELQEAITFNRSDTMFAARGGEIVYLFDTNIVVSYLSGEGPSQSGSIRELFTPKAAELSSRLTFKYLMAGRLTGQRQPAYLSQPHWNEALRQADRLAHQFAQKSAGLPPSVSNLSIILSTLEAYRDDPKALVIKAEELNVGATLNQLAEAASLDLRLTNAFIGETEGLARVQDLTHCTPYWPKISDSILARDVRHWNARLTAAHRASSKSGDIKSENINSDAMTLAAIEALYRENPAAGGVEPAVRFVLVTADKAIEQVLRTDRKRLRAQGIPLFVRPYTVYMPLLNFSGMGDALPTHREDFGDVRQVFRSVERTVKALFPFDYQDSALRRLFGNNNQSLASNTQRWSSAAERLALANAGYFVSDLSDDHRAIDQVIALLRSSDVRTATAQLLSETLTEIRGDHTEKMSALALDRLVQFESTLKGVPEARARVSLKLMDVDFMSPVRSLPGLGDADMQTMETLLEHIRRQHGPASFRKQVVALLRAAWDDPDQKAATRLLACGVYFAVGAFDSARTCAELCLASLVGRDRFGAWAREAKYCAALAIRMTLKSGEDLSVAEKLLNENLADARGGLATCRDRIELATVMLTASVVQAIERVTPARPEDAPSTFHLLDVAEISKAFDGSIIRLERALEDIEAFEGLERKAVVAPRLRTQALINLLGARIFSRFLGHHLTEDRANLKDIVGAATVLRAALDEWKRPPTFTAEIYLNIADFLGAPSAETADAAMQRILDAQALMPDLSEADLIEQRFLLQQLRVVSTEAEVRIRD